MKILVIDDQDVVGSIIARIAAQGGWQSIHSTTSQGLINTLAQEKVNVLLIDQFMPEKNGLDVVQELRENNLKIPVILFSGNTELIDRSRAESLGILRILDKPLSIPELRAALNEAKKQLLQTHL